MEEKHKLSKKENFSQMFKFLLFSCSAGIIQIGLTTFLDEVVHLVYWVSYLIGLVASVIWNFTFNRKFTFKSANNVSLAMSLVVLYYAAFTPASILWSKALEEAGWPGTIVTIFSMIINFVTEYLWTRFVVYRKSINTNNLAQKESEQQHLKQEKQENASTVEDADKKTEE